MFILRDFFPKLSRCRILFQSHQTIRNRGVPASYQKRGHDFVVEVENAGKLPGELVADDDGREGGRRRQGHLIIISIMYLLFCLTVLFLLCLLIRFLFSILRKSDLNPLFYSVLLFC